MLGIPNAIYVWAILGVTAVFILKLTPLGRYIYAIGNRETATYLSGVRTRLVLVFCFVWAGTCSAVGGMLLAGYANQAYQAMGDPYLLPTIAAVVLGGTHILGGRGTYSGTVMGVVLLTLLSSMLSVMQMQEAGPADHLWRRDYRDAAGLRPRRKRFRVRAFPSWTETL